MEDAKFYNNRLRILEISRNLPQIMNAYQATMEKQNKNLRYSILFISLLVVALFVTVFFIHRQNRKLTSRRRELAENNQQLTSLNRKLAESSQHQTDLNIQLQELNQLLMDTNKHREGLASIYIDLCAKYIDKLNKYQTLVKRKIKANQAQELLQTISSVRISQEDAATFLNRFDKAFLELYPTFVEEFNALLRNDGQLLQKSPHSLTTELRTFALIRLGVNNTADIAGLLFLSNQTIYNCRSTIKNRAIRKETFDDDVMHLCTVIK
jgi:cell division protein FtsL